MDGISAASAEQLAFHIHAHLTVFVAGAPRRIPYGIGIAAFFWLHTHAADGIIHIESPVVRTFTLGDFFDVWGEPLGRGGSDRRSVA